MLVEKKELFSCFFPVQYALDQGDIKFVSSEIVPNPSKQFPCFRSGSINPGTGKVEQWWLWDGEKSWQIKSLSKEQLELPIRGVWNYALLIQRIEQGWTPRNADYFIGLARRKKDARLMGGTNELRHYIMIGTRSTVDVALQRVGELQLPVEIIEINEAWMLVVKQIEVGDEERERIRAYLDQVATSLGG